VTVKDRRAGRFAGGPKQRLEQRLVA